MSWFCYLLECADGTLYTGITNDLRHRMRQHGVAKALHVEQAPSAQDAAKREREIKAFNPWNLLRATRAGADDGDSGTFATLPSAASPAA